MRAQHLIVIGLLSLASHTADADKTTAKKKQAKAHIEKAMKAHAKDNFPVALKELQLAYKLDAEPDLLYAIGQVYAKLDKCADAIRTYQAYLATKPAAQAAVDTQAAISSCQAKLEPPTPAPPPEPVQTVPPPPRQPDPPPPVAPVPPIASVPPAPAPHAASPARRRPWYTDKLGDALVVSGVAAGVVGIILYRSATTTLDDAEASHDINRYRELIDDAGSKRTMSAVFLVGGGVLVGAGVARYVLRGPKATHESQVGLAPARGGGVVTWSGGF